MLGVLYENATHPLKNISKVPSAWFGPLLTLMLSGQDLSVLGICSTSVRATRASSGARKNGA
jgi:multidrug efflux pump subunit AcrB